MTKIGRNEPCPCGSGKKYKNCCLGEPEEAILWKRLSTNLANMWSYDKVHKMSDAEIIAKLEGLNIPFDKLAERMVELEKHKAKTIIVVDAMGQHAGMVARDLKKAGYTAAKLGGGIASCRGDNLPVVK